MWNCYSRTHSTELTPPTHTHTHTYTHREIHTHTQRHTCTHTHMHREIHTHMHTERDTHTHTPSLYKCFLPRNSLSLTSVSVNIDCMFGHFCCLTRISWRGKACLH